MQYLTLLLFLIPAILCEDCRPLYVRLFYDPAPSPELKVDMIAMFNTFDACGDSYVRVQYLNSKEEYPCRQQKIEIAGPVVPFLEQYVHTCDLEIDSASPVTEFRYIVEGGQQGKTQQSGWNRVELSSQTLPFRIIVAANMDILNDIKYLSFATAFDRLLKLREEELSSKQMSNNFRINGIAINGGFAAGLSDKKGQNFNKIMRMVSQYSGRWPLMLNLGPSETLNNTDLALIERCFILGGVGSGSDRTGFQGYSFVRKANLALIETGTQYFSRDGSRTAQFNRTLSSLSSFFSKNHENGNQFSIVLSHYALICTSEDKSDAGPYDCEKGAKNLLSLKNLLTDESHGPTDLYIGAYQNNYERTYPFREGKFMTLQQSRYNRGDFINVNQGTGGYNATGTPASSKTYYTAIKTAGMPGFGILTINGNADLKVKNVTDIISSQTTARMIYKRQTSHSASDSNILSNSYLYNQALNELDLFLLNYKHISISPSFQMVVQDVFRIVTNPLPTPRHLLHPSP